ncbi:hypothetical protein WR25_14222 isoform C [Diploscapter pachys]|uniref:Ferredoxin--NADP(+) reductase n=1 Tax=Diploscapter pachys TaxID=2018661 RepID=A0A2A2KT72_9BILA|nr:hypothetical protein WR25_14222 isoform A [Diploscapter pachys]PAV77118.1 hypothetical protein WR25_14222 isoform B [Diploscapter pachys]PAV77119.1 hypothetical protein WR25_14222 isoform C [Diploscapter pachys]
MSSLPTKSPQEEQPQSVSSNRINPVDFERKRLQPSKCSTSPNHFYITKKTSLQGEARKLEKALNEKFDEVFVHGLGTAINKTVDLAFEMDRLMGGTVGCHIQTSTVEACSHAPHYSAKALLTSTSSNIPLFPMVSFVMGLLPIIRRVGQDVAFDELVSNYDAIVLAYGSYRQRKLQIPGDKSTNVISGSDFVAWYNGVPNSKAPLLDNSEAVVIGNGNVALDCARIISLGVLGKLNETDVPLERLKLLENSAINRIKIVGRRGPLDVSFTIKELREQFRVEGWQSYIEAAAREELEPEKWPAGIARKHQRLFEARNFSL